METIAKTRLQPIAAERVKVKEMSGLWTKMEDYRFPIIVMTLLIIVFIAGVAAAFGTENSTFQLALVTLPATVAEALVLGVAPMRAIFYASIISLIADAMVFAF